MKSELAISKNCHKVLFQWEFKENSECVFMKKKKRKKEKKIAGEFLLLDLYNCITLCCEETLKSWPQCHI